MMRSRCAAPSRARAAPPPAPVSRMMCAMDDQAAEEDMDEFDDMVLAEGSSAQAPTDTKGKEPKKPTEDEWADGGLGSSGSGAVDFTKLPAALDAKYEQHDIDSALRPTKLKLGEAWQRSAQKALLSKPSKSTLNAELQTQEKNKAFDLLDALSRSGALPLTSTALHVVVAATHCFDTSLMDTVIVKNVNPIEKLERSALIMASTIHDVEPRNLIQASQQTRIATFSAPMLLPPLTEARSE